MSNTTEIEDESVQQVPTTLETEEFVDAQDVPVEQVNNNSSPNPDNMEMDKPTPLDNGNSPPQTEVVADENSLDSKPCPQQPHQDIPTPALVDDEKRLAGPGVEPVKDVISETNGTPDLKAETCAVDGIAIFSSHAETAKPTVDIETKSPEGSQNTHGQDTDVVSKGSNEPATPYKGSSDNKAEVDDKNKTVMSTPKSNGNSVRRPSFLLDENNGGSESGTEEEQSAFMKELDSFFREKGVEFKHPKFYGEGLNCLKLWRFVMRLGGYDKVTSCKLWRQVGESFNPPKTCTTVSWTFRGFYEKILLDYERYITGDGEIKIPIASKTEPKSKTKSKAKSEPKSGPNAEPMHVDNQASGSGRARRDAAARAMKGWHSLRFLGNGEVSGPIIKDKNSQREKDLKSVGLLKRKKPSYVEHAVKSARKTSGVHLNVEVIDLGAPADWVKINVQKSKDSFEVYALVPGLLREEVRVQSDPAGRLVISGEPEHADNPWGVAPFKKVVSLPSRIDPHQTTAVVTLHGQLYVRVPFDQSD